MATYAHIALAAVTAPATIVEYIFVAIAVTVKPEVFCCMLLLPYLGCADSLNRSLVSGAG